MKVVYPGSFDPPTRGHIDVARRAAALYEDVVVLVIGNPDKRSTLDAGARAQLLRRCLAGLENVRVEHAEGLLADAAKRFGAQAILRGLRGEADYQAERPVADGFLRIFQMETVFMQCDPALGFVSSSLARQLLRLGGDAAALVPECIFDDVKAAYR